jgi:hypothetical protein
MSYPRTEKPAEAQRALRKLADAINTLLARCDLPMRARFDAAATDHAGGMLYINAGELVVWTFSATNGGRWFDMYEGAKGANEGFVTGSHDSWDVAVSVVGYYLRPLAKHLVTHEREEFVLDLEA